jgi:hypothetical protein
MHLVVIAACDLRRGTCSQNMELLAVLIIVAALALGMWWYLRRR